jgi:anti-sigma factor ChrR (cupin superfamily)
MISIPKIIGVISCSAVLCLSLSSTTQATGSMRHDPCADRKGGLPNLLQCDEKMRQGIQTSKGEMHSSAMQATGSMRHDPCADRKGGLPNLVKCDEKMR